MRGKSASASTGAGSVTRPASGTCCDTPFYIACLKLTGPALRRRRRRRDRAGEGRGPAGLRRPRRADRPGGRARARAARRRGLDRVDPARVRDRRPRGDVHRDRRDQRHRRQHRASTTTPSAARCSSTSSTSRRCATSSCPRSCAPARWRSRSRPPAPRPRWPSGSRRQIADEFGEPYARLAVLLNEVRGWAKGTLPTYQDRKAFFEGIVNGEPDPIELLRAGDEAAVRELIAAAQRAHEPRHRVGSRAIRAAVLTVSTSVSRRENGGPLGPEARRRRRGGGLRGRGHGGRPRRLRADRGPPAPLRRRGHRRSCSRPAARG